MPRATSDAREWATSGLDLYVEPTGPWGLRETLERRLRDAIAGGRLQAGTRLPSTRSLAQDLGLSRGTVLEAYTHLAAEGWIRGRRGSGTVVAAIGRADPAEPGTTGPAHPEPHPRRQSAGGSRRGDRGDGGPGAPPASTSTCSSPTPKPSASSSTRRPGTGSRSTGSPRAATGIAPATWIGPR